MQIIDQRQLRKHYKAMATLHYQKCEDALLNKPNGRIYCKRGGCLCGEYTDLCYYWVIQASWWQRGGIAPYSVSSCPKTRPKPPLAPPYRPQKEGKKVPPKTKSRG